MSLSVLRMHHPLHPESEYLGKDVLKGRGEGSVWNSLAVYLHRDFINPPCGWALLPLYR